LSGRQDYNWETMLRSAEVYCWGNNPTVGKAILQSVVAGIIL
jgi:hypothetical protein